MTDPLHVAIHVGQLIQPVPGGIGRYIRELIPALQTAGAEISTFAAGDSTGTLARDLPNFHDLGRPAGSLRYELWHRLRRPRLHIGADNDNDIDIVFAPSLAIPPSGTRPLVVTIHDVATLHYPQHFTKRGVRFHRRGLDLARRHASAIIVPSNFVRAELTTLGFSPERVHAIPHGVRIDPAPSDDTINSELHGAGVDGPFVVFVGTLEPRKGVTTLIRAMRVARVAVPELQLVIAGPRGWGSIDGVEDLEEPWIHELGHVDDTRLDALYRRAVLCALPSRYEGFGFPVIEAMARGCPVAVANTTSLPETAAGAGLVIDVDDHEAWAEAITRVTHETTFAENLRSLGLARVRELTWSRTAAAHLDAFYAAYHDTFAERPRR